MIKTAPTLRRLSVLALFVFTCFGALLYLWLSFGGSVPLKPKGYRIEVPFAQANELATQGDVRIAGVSVGKVVGLRQGANNATVATLELQSQFAPLRADTRATLRLKSLLGETYVQLVPGQAGRSVPDGGTLSAGRVAPNVHIDEILSSFDPRTRNAFQTWMQAQAGAVGGRGADINAAFGSLPGFVDSGEQLLTTLDAQGLSLRALVANTGSFFSAISQRQGQLSGLITSADRLFATVAQRNQQFADVFRALPDFETQSRLALPALTRFGQRSDPVVRQLEPIATDLTPTFATSARLATQFRGLFDRLGPTVTAAKRGLPAFDRILAQLPPLLGAFAPFLQNANPIVRYIGRYPNEITGFFANVTAASLSHDNGLPRTPNEVHYLRTAQTLTPQALAFYPRPLGVNRDDAYRPPGALRQLPALPVLNPSLCGNGDVAPPTSAIPATLAPLVQQYAFRTTGRDVARPPCIAQGPLPGFATLFPQLRAESAAGGAG